MPDYSITEYDTIPLYTTFKSSIDWENGSSSIIQEVVNYYNFKNSNIQIRKKDE